jgi:hypothetical protein
MTDQFRFSQAKIAELTQKVGVDIRPAIECKLDQEKLFFWGKQLADKHPNLFESLVQSPTDFHINKKFIFPGKGEVELATLGVTPRGICFIFPQMLSIVEEEIQLDNIEDIVLDCLNIFRKTFPGKSISRVGLVNEYIFETGPIESVKLICSRFTRLSVPPNGEINIRINRPDDDYNKKIILNAVQKIERVPEMPGRQQVRAYGVRVVVDYNNRDVSTSLNDDKIRTIIYQGKEYNKKELYQFLNSSFGGSDG